MHDIFPFGAHAAETCALSRARLVGTEYMAPSVWCAHAVEKCALSRARLVGTEYMAPSVWCAQAVGKCVLSRARLVGTDRVHGTFPFGVHMQWENAPCRVRAL